MSNSISECVINIILGIDPRCFVHVLWPSIHYVHVVVMCILCWIAWELCIVCLTGVGLKTWIELYRIKGADLK